MTEPNITIFHNVQVIPQRDYMFVIEMVKKEMTQNLLFQSYEQGFAFIERISFAEEPSDFMTGVVLRAQVLCQELPIDRGGG